MTPESSNPSEPITPGEANSEAAPPANEPVKKKPRKNRRKRMPEGFAPGAHVDMTGPRHQARVLAMQLLYEHDLTQHDIEDILDRLASDEPADPLAIADTDPEEGEDTFEDVPPPVAERTLKLVRGVIARQAEIDPYIEEAAPQFPIPQLAMVDRNILRLAIYELLHAPDVPYKAAINEAIEIAKHFGGPNSGKFVNGVLGTISKKLPDERKAKKAR